MHFEKDKDGRYLIDINAKTHDIQLEVNGTETGLLIDDAVIPWNVVDELRKRYLINVDLVGNIDFLSLWPATTYKLGEFISPRNMKLNIATTVDDIGDYRAQYATAHEGTKTSIIYTTPGIWNSRIQLSLQDDECNVIFTTNLATRLHPEQRFIHPKN